jgi:hypothetical protein
MQQTTPPFEVGQRYRVRRDYAFLNHSFRAGEVVVFSTHAYDPHEGLTRYWFRSIDSTDTNVWHVFDDQEQETHWHEMFEPINAA